MGDGPREIVREGYDRVAADYLAARTTDVRDVELLDELMVRLTRDDRVLDAGCGAGVPEASRLRAGGLAVVGLDCSAAQLGLAQRAGLPAVAQADLASLPFRDGSFRAAVSYYAIIHVPRADHLTVFRELARVLEPGGLVLLCLGAHDLPEDHDPNSWLGAAMYWSHFDAETNVQLVQEAGFTLIWHRLVDDPMGHANRLFVLATRGR